jgi:hypothetical protein
MTKCVFVRVKSAVHQALLRLVLHAHVVQMRPTVDDQTIQTKGDQVV